MGTKSDSPKLSPAERLARKRAAARLRQQRCRARKRQTMLEKKRGEVVRQRRVNITHDHPMPAVVMHTVQHRPHSRFPTYNPVHSTTESGESWGGVGVSVDNMLPDGGAVRGGGSLLDQPHH